MTLAILGIGTALPEAVIDQDDALALARSLASGTPEQDTWLPAMYAGTGIRTRHHCLGTDVLRDVIDGTRHSGSVFVPTGLPGDRGPTTAQRLEHYARLAPPLAMAAARAALEKGRVVADEVTHVITVSCTGFLAPGLDQALIQGLDLPADVNRTHVGYMGCHGALNGLRVAHAFADDVPRTRVLLCAVELCCLHYHYGWDPQKMVANALFADGAAAVVAGPATSAPPGVWRLIASGAFLFPDSADAMTWTIGDHGFEMTLSKRVPALIGAWLRPWLANWLGERGILLKDIASWAIHPGGPRILSAVAEALGLGTDELATSREVLAACGNMSSPTLLFILDRLRQTGATRPCLALGFGPGLAVEAALLC